MSGRGADFVRVALLDHDVRSGRGFLVDRRGGARDHERDGRGVGGEREPVRSDLVGDVAVGRHAVAPDDHGVDGSPRDQPGGGAIDDQLVWYPELGQLVGGEPRPLEERPGLGGEDQFEIAAVVALGDHGERGATAWSGQRAGVAVGEDPPRTREQVGAVGSDRVARRRLLGFDRPRLPQRRGGRVGRRLACRPRHAVHSIGQVDRGRPGSAENGHGLVERVWRGVTRQLERDPVRRRHPDQRRAPDGQAADRAGDVIGGAELELTLAPRERGLVDRPEHPVLEAEGDDARPGRSCGGHRRIIAARDFSPPRRTPGYPSARTG